MRLVTYRGKHEAPRAARAGVLVEDGVIDVSRLVGPLPIDVLGLIQGGQSVLDRVREGATRARATPLADVRLLAPIPRPPKIVCIGVNYADHAAEAGRALPPRPSIFLKAPSAVIGPGDPIVKPATTEQLDYEVELAVVIGKTAKAVSREDALSYVAGYTIMNDVSARDMQLAKDGGVILGKNFDQF
ncbi:MAG: fumarylacetoacetate hydrolase family protein [Chloroflexota bacterium]